jgi:hypothetical protein
VTVAGEGDAPDPGAVVRADAGSERFAALREEVEGVDALAVGDRVEVFERVNEGIAAELARLDEV